MHFFYLSLVASIFLSISSLQFFVRLPRCRRLWPNRPAKVEKEQKGPGQGWAGLDPLEWVLPSPSPSEAPTTSTKLRSSGERTSARSRVTAEHVPTRRNRGCLPGTTTTDNSLSEEGRTNYTCTNILSPLAVSFPFSRVLHLQRLAAVLLLQDHRHRLLQCLSASRRFLQCISGSTDVMCPSCPSSIYGTLQSQRGPSETTVHCSRYTTHTNLRSAREAA